MNLLASDPAFSLQTLILHCIGGTATHKSLKSLAVVTVKNEADNRASSETQGQIKGARESLNGRKNMARRKVKNGEKSYFSSCHIFPPV